MTAKTGARSVKEAAAKEGGCQVSVARRVHVCCQPAARQVAGSIEGMGMGMDGMLIISTDSGFPCFCSLGSLSTIHPPTALSGLLSGLETRAHCCSSTHPASCNRANSQCGSPSADQSPSRHVRHSLAKLHTQPGHQSRTARCWASAVRH